MAIPATLPAAAQASLTTVAAMVPRGDRCLPVDESLRPLFPHGGLVRGQVTGFGGSAAMSLAVASVMRSVVAGSWLSVVGIEGFGVEAAGDLGLLLSRVVAVDGGASAFDWADRVAVCADGFDLIMTTPPSGLSGRGVGALRRVRQRLQARGSVLIMVDPGGTLCDAYLDTEASNWVGVGAGHGALLARMVTVTASGRRVQGTRRHRLWLPSHTGAVEPVHNQPVQHQPVQHQPVQHQPVQSQPVSDHAPAYGHDLVS